MKDKNVFFESHSQRMTKEYILKHVVYAFFNISDYRTLPHKRVLDFIAFYKISSVDGTEFIIEYEDLRKNQISIEELDLAAKYNASPILKMNTIEQTMIDLGIDNADFEIPKRGVPLFVLKPMDQENATIVFFCNKLLREVTKVLDCDIYIIPSSIHELIILRKKDFSESKVKDLKSIILDINETIVSSEDFLSNNLYEFSRDSGQLSIV